MFYNILFMKSLTFTLKVQVSMTQYLIEIEEYLSTYFNFN